MCSHKLWIIPPLKMYIIYKWEQQTWIKSPLREVNWEVDGDALCNVSPSYVVLVLSHGECPGSRDSPVSSNQRPYTLVNPSTYCLNWVIFINGQIVPVIFNKVKIEISQLAGPRVLVCSCSKLLLQAVHLSLQLSRHMLLVPGELGDTGHKVVLKLAVRRP